MSFSPGIDNKVTNSSLNFFLCYCFMEHRQIGFQNSPLQLALCSAVRTKSAFTYIRCILYIYTLSVFNSSVVMRFSLTASSCEELPNILSINRSKILPQLIVVYDLTYDFIQGCTYGCGCPTASQLVENSLTTTWSCRPLGIFFPCLVIDESKLN